MSEPDSHGLLAGLVARPVAVTMVFLAAIVFGLVSFQRLPIELMPELGYPTLTVRTAWDGAAPQEVEQQISRPIEQNLATLDGLVSLQSRSRAGSSDVVLGFDWDADLAEASQSVREQLQTTFLPDDADRPLILRYDPSMEPFLRLALGYDPEGLDLTPDRALLMLRELADEELRRALEGMDGVAAVRVRGGLERELRVAVHQDRLAARQLSPEQVAQALTAENVDLAGGSVFEGDTEYLIRTLATFETVDALRALQIRRNDGTLVPLTDVATVEETHAERDVVSHLDGNEAVELELYREADANVVDVAARVKTALEGTDPGYTEADLAEMPPGRMRKAMEEQLAASKGLRDRLPDGVQLVILDDQAAFIELAISNLRTAVLGGGLLAVGVLFLFLRDFRSTGIIGLAIPVSVVVGVAPLYLGGVSLNLMSLGGLALGVGMLVDNAVVVLEAIQRHVEDGMERRRASVVGTDEVAGAVFASTMTTVAVFAPIAFVEGIGGELFGDLAIAVVGSLLASLAVALLLVPVLAALGADGPAEDDGGVEVATMAVAERLAPVREEFAHARQATGLGRLWLPWAALRYAVRALTAVGLALGSWMIAHGLRLAALGVRAVRRPVAGALLAVADRFRFAYDGFATRYDRLLGGILRRPGGVLVAAVLAGGVATVLADRLGAEVVPEVHQGRFLLDVSLPVGTPLRATVREVGRIEAIVDAHPDVRTVYATIGTDGRADARPDEGENTARIRVELTPGGDLALREDAVMADLRAWLTEATPATLAFGRPSLFAMDAPLEVVVTGEDLDRLQATGDALVPMLSSLDGIADVRTSLQPGNPEIRIRYDRLRLSRYGLDTRTVAERVRDRIQGKEATELSRGEQRVPVRVQLVEGERSSREDLASINVNPDIRPPVPLRAVADLEEGIGPSEIRRVDQQRAVVLSANLAGFDLSGAVQEIREVMADFSLGEDMRWALAGQAQELGGAVTAMGLALGLAVFLVYVIMASTFENLLHPLLILFTVPLAAVGVVLGLWVTGTPASVVAGLGMIVLAGVVVNNAIVLVDAINRLRAEGEDAVEAIAHAARIRLRPILITTTTTVLGLVPLLVGAGAGAEIQRPLAVTVVFGLTTSTLLTLGVIPAAYALLARGASVTRPSHKGSSASEVAPS